LSVTGGTAVFTLTIPAAATLAEHGIRLTPVQPARATMDCPPGVEVKVTGGRIQPEPFKGSLSYGKGGFRFTDAEDRVLELTDGEADLNAGTTTAVLNGETQARIPLAEYAVGADTVELASASELTLDRTDIALTAEAAAAFNETFKAEIFAAGDALFQHAGTLEVQSRLPAPDSGQQT
jgi:hypothetical protein